MRASVLAVAAAEAAAVAVVTDLHSLSHMPSALPGAFFRLSLTFRTNTST